MLHIVNNIGKNYISYDFVACKPVHLDVAGLNCLHHGYVPPDTLTRHQLYLIKLVKIQKLKAICFLQF